MSLTLPILLLIPSLHQANTPSEAGQAPPEIVRLGVFGCATCEGIESFAAISAIALTPDRVYVLDSREPFVRVFDPAGNGIAALGGRGRGPGEFVAPTRIHVRADGSLQVLDLRTRRVTLLAADGHELSNRPFIGGFPLAVDRSAGSGWTWAVTTDFRAPTLRMERWRDDSPKPDSLGPFDPSFPRSAEDKPSQLVALAARRDGGYALGDGTMEYRIGIYDRDGRRTSEIRRDIARPTRTADEIRDEEASRARQAARREAAANIESRGRGAPPLPPVASGKSHFLVDALAYDGSGRLWVRTERGGLRSTVFDVFDTTGVWLGEVRAGEPLRRCAIGGDRMACVTTDADDVEYVALYQIRNR